MRAIKRINHNAAICEDQSGRQLVAMGRGIGFGDLPREVDLSEIQRTFYDIDDKYLAFIEEVDPAVLEFAAQPADLATQQLSYSLSPNLPITLADHIQFALKRAHEHLIVPMPLSYDVEQAHPLEYKLGELAVRGIQKTFSVRMPRNEAAGIALSLLNAATSLSAARIEAGEREAATLERFIELIEDRLGARVDRDSFAFARFATHVRYLLKRLQDKQPIDSDNSALYELLSEQYPEVARCANEMNGLIEATYGAPFAQEELVYLIMHINRVVASQEQDRA